MSESSILVPYKLCCTEIPEGFLLDKTIAKRYFRQFGSVKKLIFRPKQLACIVEFSNYKSYVNALNNGGEFDGQLFNVFPHESPKKAGRKDKKTVQNEKKSPKKVNLKEDPDWDADPEVRAELEAMGAIYKKDYNLRPAKMDVDLIEKPSTRQIRRKAPVSKLKQSLTAEQMDLIGQIRQRATTVEEKYRILDARDKLIRLKLKKSGNLKAGPTVGTCPDMCPEKERLMRETQHQVAMYEQLPKSETGGVAGAMNHSIAVKQYSRSSADQEAPLAHELRPVKVLQMTMNYLINEIMDLSDFPDTNLAEWYHFLWDRTRGIRKDITQQELTSGGSVELVEQCARFHIYCSARLVAEDASVFDQKINSENLTKCLQSLKYMYHDLALKGELCRNEPEFRAYIILLNLNNSSFMADLQKLSSRVQKSPEVKFALQIHSALDKNNYVRFFKLVHTTSFLNSCILLRYFVQVRLKALESLLKCYSPHSVRGQTSFPVAELVKMLAFEDMESAIDFLKFYGLSCKASGTETGSGAQENDKFLVYLNRGAFYVPEVQYVQERAINVIESKRKSRVGQVIYGSDDLPEKRYLSHRIQNSFDDNGYLIIDDDLLTDLNNQNQSLSPEITSNDVTDSKQTNIQPEAALKKPEVNKIEHKTEKINNFNSDNILKEKPQIKEIIPDILETKPNAAPKTQPEVPKSIFSKPEPVKETSISFKPNIFASKSIFSSSSFKTGSQAIFTPPNLNMTPKLTENKTQSDINVQKPEVKKESTIIAKLPPNESIKIEVEPIKSKETLKQEAEAIKAEIQRQLAEKQRKIEQEKQRLAKIKAKQLTADVKAVICDLILKVDEKVRQEAIESFQQRIRRKLTLKYANRWRLNAHKSNRKRKALDCGPYWTLDRNLDEVAANLAMESQNLTLACRKRYRSGNPMTLNPKLNEMISTFDCDAVFPILNDLATPRSDSSYRISEDIYWKVSISLPDAQEMPFGLERLTVFLNSHFWWKNGRYLLESAIPPYPVRKICIEKTGNPPESDANALIFIGNDFNAKFQLRMAAILKNYGLNTRLPLVVVLQHPDSLPEAERKLKQLQQRQIVSNYLIISDTFSYTNLTTIFAESIQFLASKHPGPPPLLLDMLYDTLQRHLCTELWRKANSFAKWNTTYEKCLKSPQIVIKLYNEAVDRLTGIYVNEAVKEYAKFPEQFRNEQEIDRFPCDYRHFPAFCYTSTFDSYLTHVKRILTSLHLPLMFDKWPPVNQVDLERIIWQYCQKIFDNADKPFLKIMAAILQFSDVANVNWTSIIEVISLELLRQLNFRMPMPFKCQFKELFVIYENKALNDYSKSDWMYVGNPVIQEELSNMLVVDNDTVDNAQAVKNTLEVVSSDDIEKEIEKARQKLDSWQQIDSVRQQVEEFNSLLADLKSSIEIDRKISETIEKRLSDALKDS